MAIITQTMQDGIAVLTFDDPAAAVNTLSYDALTELESRLDDLAAAPPRGVVIASAKAAFIAGANLRQVQQMQTPADARRVIDWVHRIQRRIETMPVPVVAAVNGVAMGGGLELALACHGRVATPDARLGLPELDLGLMPGAGGTQRLPRLIGLGPALEVILGGRVLTAAEAQAMGLIAALAPPDRLVAEAAALAARIAPAQPWDAAGWTAAPPAGSPEAAALLAAAAVRADKRRGDADIAEAEILAVIREGYALPLQAALAREAEGFARLAASATAKNRIRTGFLGPQVLRAMGSRPADVPPCAFRRIAVAGGGLMGGGIAFTAAQNGIGVAVIEADAAGAERTRAALARTADRLVRRGKMDADKAAAILGRITVHDTMPDLPDVQAAIEAVPEVPAIKAGVLARLAAALPEGALIASNTSTMAIGGLAAHVPQPGRFIGMHFFSPVEVMPLLEIISGPGTAPAALAGALDLAKALRKLPITVQDGPGFYTSRIVGSYTGEALTLLAEGVAPGAIDAAALAFGMPIGPLAMADTVGLPLLRDIYGALAAGGSPVVARGCRAQEALAALVGAGRRGRPQGGIFDYPENGAPQGWAGLPGLFPADGPAPDAAAIKRRLFHIQALESIRAMEDGIITDPTQIDVASTLGWAFPKSWGGVLSYVDTLGAARFAAESEVLAAAHGPRFAPPALLRRMAAEGGRFHPV
ncbi:3-hydroxyacyl-CoA dehydrogenase NAD-binding domain-containing protein [Ruixingdingia sedimenti]|uniref:3-hydroxyacyl-CoA dehydrogenase NAD-binding domain-containing protein n=1 Tax=Ruixingdingia sedimenti TaxID=3073604 RepID=A0ABU1F9T1_9RHOB|nr:3-hydroxyacyl-CoA dehydrogenase NAD-binding domain-containing protein [Xinfangfangia sp. LG-4]MDR5653184.1 3-hydroxyacyl-CoA dehydrogenase NAD-binding domain-containing protein [Xinfangfangia sp. LG-4]